MIELNIPRTRHALCVQTFRRRSDSGQWFSVGPVSDWQRSIGFDVVGPRHGLAVYLYPDKDHR